jgi:hypothetical protein
MTKSLESLAKSTQRLKARNDMLAARINGPSKSAPPTTLEDATERAKKYWDSLEKKRSIPPSK